MSHGPPSEKLFTARLSDYHPTSVNHPLYNPIPNRPHHGRQCYSQQSTSTHLLPAKRKSPHATAKLKISLNAKVH